MTRSSQAFAADRPAVDAHPTLPEGWQRENLVTAIDRAAPALRLSRQALHTFRVMISKTVPTAFCDPTSEPVCYASQVELASELRLTSRQLRTHENALVAAGLIEKRTMANGARSGFHGCGIYFSVAIAMLPHLIHIIERQETERREAAQLRGRRSTHLRHIKRALEALRPGFEDHPEVMAHKAAFAAWPGAKKLHRMALADLTGHEAEAFDLCRRVLAFCEKVQKTSAGTEANCRPYIQDTTQETYVSCNASVEKRPAGKPAESPFSRAGPGGPDCYENKDAAASEARKAQFFDQLTPQRLYWLCSPSMRMHLDIQKKGRDVPDAHDFELAAIGRLPELGINSSAWAEACNRMGAELATICVLLTDANIDNPDNPIRSPGGYLRALTRAHQTGTLNIFGGLIGLSQRRAVERD